MADREMKKPDYQFNLILLGGTGAGKTSLVHHYMGKPFDENCPTSFGYEQVDGTMKIGEKLIQLHVHIAAGNSGCDNLIPSYVNTVHGIFFVVSGQELPKRLDKVFDHYFPIAQQHAQLKFERMLVITKNDLDTPDLSLAQTLAQQHNMMFAVTSANFAQNVDFMFEAMVNKILESFMAAGAKNGTPDSFRKDGGVERQMALMKELQTRKIDYHFNIILLGSGGAGKTSLMKRWRGDPFDRKESPSERYEVMNKIMRVGEHVLRIHLNVAAGQDKFTQLMGAHLKQVYGVIFVYSVLRADRLSLPKVFNLYLPAVDKFTEFQVQKLLVANKCDDGTSPNTTEAEAMAAESGMHFLRSSAKDKLNVTLVFESMAHNLLETCLAAEAQKQIPQGMRRDRAAEMQLNMIQQTQQQLLLMQQQLLLMQQQQQRQQQQQNWRCWLQ